MHPTGRSFIKYLEVKKTIDDRSLNLSVLNKFAGSVREPGNPGTIRVLEIGCGIGVMAERLIDWDFFANLDYTGVDIDPELVDEANDRLRKYGRERRFVAVDRSPDVISLENSGRTFNIRFVAEDIFDFVAGDGAEGCYDVLMAHAFLDLVDPAASVPRFLLLLRPGGLVYLTLNFDGMTIFEPAPERELDALVTRLYHETMDKGRIGGYLSGNSRAGRLLPSILRECNVETLAAGSSDWVLVPESYGYKADEAYFLHFIIDTVSNALLDHPEIGREALLRWTGQRHAQIDGCELVYIAHQIDILGRLNGGP